MVGSKSTSTSRGVPLLKVLLAVLPASPVQLAAQSALHPPLADSGVTGNSVMLCTRVLWNDNPIAVIAGRTADWFKADQPGDTDRTGASHPKLHVLPRGLAKTGDASIGQAMVNPATWTARYGSVVVVARGRYVFDGMNEKGLAAHALALSSDYGARDPSLKGVHTSLLVPYILDHAATVEEAIALISHLQPVSVIVDGFAMDLSLTIEDRSGNSAVIEWPTAIPPAPPSTAPTADPPRDDKFVPVRVTIGKFRAFVYQGRHVRVMANEDLAASHLQQKANWPYAVDTATRSTVIPGNAWRSFRWARAAFFSDFLSRMKRRTVLEARAALMSVMRIVSNPIGAPGDQGGPNDRGDETDWRTLSDLTNLEYIFDNPRTLATFGTDLKRLDFQSGAGVRVLDPGDPSLHGDVTGLYRPTSTPVPGIMGR